MDYRIKALCCFVGAHYFSFVRFNDSQDKSSYWRLYNDEETETYNSWFEVLKTMIDIKVYPTLIFYEKCKD